MHIKPRDHRQCPQLADAVRSWLVDSRFTADVHVECSTRLGRTVKIEHIRLRVKKGYCGAHPGPCQTDLFFDRPHMVAHYLEGSDWIGYDEGINDLLDRLEIDANVWTYNQESTSGRYYIRKGRRRRLVYGMVTRNDGIRTFNHWERVATKDEYADYCGKIAPRAEYPSGTPGSADWRPDLEEVYVEQAEAR